MNITLYNQSKVDPVESILIKYNFLIILPKLQRPQSYTITIRLSSKVAVIKKMKAEIEMSSSGPILKLMMGRNAVVSINYVDYLVARNFLDAIDEWLESVKTVKRPKVVKALLRNTHFVPILSKYILSALALFFIYRLLQIYLPQNSVDLNLFANFTLISLASLYLVSRLSRSFGSIIENALDDIMELSYVKLNKGDERIINESQKQNKKNFLKSTSGLALNIILGIVTSLIANQLMKP